MTARQVEQQKYDVAYMDPGYRMGKRRMDASVRYIEESGVSGSFLDVGCGRGELLAVASSLGYAPVHGTEIVTALLEPQNVSFAEAHDLPFDDNSYDLVTMFDVIEHLIEEDIAPALRELERVARQGVILTAASFSHRFRGVELHPSARPLDDWRNLIEETCDGRVEELPRYGSISHGFRIWPRSS